MFSTWLAIVKTLNHNGRRLVNIWEINQFMSHISNIISHKICTHCFVWRCLVLLIYIIGIDSWRFKWVIYLYSSRLLHQWCCSLNLCYLAEFRHFIWKDYNSLFTHMICCMNTASGQIWRDFIYFQKKISVCGNEYFCTDVSFFGSVPVIKHGQYVGDSLRV